MPTGSPTILQPSLDKIDFDALGKDIGRFRDHYPSGVADFWETWINETDQLTVDECEWPLKKIIDAQRLHPTIGVIPAELQQLHEKENQETTEVSLIFLV